MNLQDYIQSKRRAYFVHSMKTAIEYRWDKRINPMSLQAQGERGANIYLKQYGKQIKSPKCIAMAQYADEKGFPDFALGFWKKAYELDCPVDAKGVVLDTSSGNFDKRFSIDVFPVEMLPGNVMLSQPETPSNDHTYYIESDEYWAQPDVINRVVVFATPAKVWFQNMEQTILPTPRKEIEWGLMAVTKLLGSFIVECEISLDKHMQPFLKVAACLWHEGFGDLHIKEMQIDGAEMITDFLLKESKDHFGAFFTARNTKEKRALIGQGQGEVFFLKNLMIDNIQSDEYVKF